MMQKKTLGLLLLSVSLAVALAGCGGGGKSNPTPARTVSTDYYGMEVGAKYSYHTTYTDKINTSLSNEFDLSTVVYSVDNSTPGTSVFKVGAKHDGSTSVEGEYVAKITSNNVVNYRSYGAWANNGSDNYDSSHSSLLMSDPVTREFSVLQESITVPAGAFNAYRFTETAQGKDATDVQTTTTWFVPYIFDCVKKTEDYTKNGVLQSTTVTVLTKTQFGVNTTIPVASFSKASSGVPSAYSILKPFRKQ